MQKLLFPETMQEDPACSGIKKNDLNPAQYEAVACGDGPVLVIAGAGSGKTRTLVYRVAYLLEQKVAPEKILLLTFTRKAAQQMLHRASLLLDDSCRSVVGGTFHSVANLLLRHYGRHLGFAPNFTILDRADSEGIVNLLKSSLNLGGAGKRFPSKKVIIDILGKSVNKAIEVSELVAERYQHLVDFIDDILLIRKHYQQFKVDHALMDYDDLLVNWRRLLVDFPEVRDAMANRFSHILVDEYQDTNPIQAEIVHSLARFHNNVMAVGDDSQSIYSFRGADFRNIMDFPNKFKDCRIIRLEQNYRSSQSILSVTNAIIEKATERYAKTLYSNIEGGEKPVVFAARNEAEQALYVLRKIQERHEQGVAYHDMAVLFRSGYHSYRLELELTNRQVDFEKRGGMKLTESAHIKDVLAYLRILCNPDDNLSWNRILLQLEKVGPKTAQNILAGIKSSEDPIACLRRYPARKSWKKGFDSLVDLLQRLAQPGRSPGQIFEIVLEFYQEKLERLYPDDYPKRSRDLEHLRTLLAGYDTLQSFIDDTALDPPDPDGGADSYSSQFQDRLVLSTIHSAKGLEWDSVFVINMADGKFPSARAVYPEEIEEERRLLYVAATRAKRHLYFTYPRESSGPDRFAAFGTLSPFLVDVPPALINKGKATPQSSDFIAYGLAPLKGKVSEQATFATGDLVRHPFFGKGKIESLQGPKTVHVYFDRHGKKTLHLDYAKLELLG